MAKRKIAVYGLRRSGNHAFVEWLNKNLGGSSEQHRISPYMTYCGKSCYVNSIAEYENTSALDINYRFADFTFENLIVTYEDVPFAYEASQARGFPKIVLIRDILNVVASRYKMLSMHRPDQIEKGNLCSVNESMFQTWLNHASIVSSHRIKLVKFESWITSLAYRNKISELIGFKNIDAMHEISFHGGGSSFSGRSRVPTPDELKNRWKEVKIPTKFLDRIGASDISLARKKLGYEPQVF